MGLREDFVGIKGENKKKGQKKADKPSILGDRGKRWKGEEGRKRKRERHRPTALTDF